MTPDHILENEVRAAEESPLRESMTKLYSYLSLLRYRANIKWSDPGLPSQNEIDQALGEADRLLGWRK